MRNNLVSEAAIQSQAFINLWNNRPDLRGRFFTINNNSENAIKGSLNKALGVLAGVSDMCFLLEDGRVLWIEWKTLKGHQSRKQEAWGELCCKLGHLYIIVRNEEEFLKIINFYVCEI